MHLTPKIRKGHTVPVLEEVSPVEKNNKVNNEGCIKGADKEPWEPTRGLSFLVIGKSLPEKALCERRIEK